MTPLSRREYRELLAFRTTLRRFERWSAAQAHRAGLTPAQHQLLLAIKGHADDDHAPTVGDIANTLILRHHSASELVERTVAANFVTRDRDPQDGRVIRLRLTAVGEETLARLSHAHREELRRLHLLSPAHGR